MAFCGSPQREMSYAVKGVTTERWSRCWQLCAGCLWRCRSAACHGGGARNRYSQGHHPARAGAFLPHSECCSRIFATTLCGPGSFGSTVWRSMSSKTSIASWTQQGRERPIAAASTSSPREGNKLRRAALDKRQRYVGQAHSVTVEHPQNISTSRIVEADQGLCSIPCMHSDYGTVAPAEAAGRSPSLRTTVTGIVHEARYRGDRERHGYADR